MKKVISATLALCSIVLISCQKENIDKSGKTPSIAPQSFTVSAPATKTTLDGLHVYWAEGDQIRVYGHNTTTGTYTDNTTYTLSGGAGQATAVFTKDNNSEMAGTYDEYYAVYPGNLTISGLPDNMVFPRLNVSPNHFRSQSPTAGQYDPNLAIMTATYDGSKFIFRHGVAFIKITIPDDDVTKIDINFTNNCLADTPTYTTSSGAVASVSNSSKNVTTAEGSYTKGVAYYLAAVPRPSYSPSTTVITFTGGEKYTTDHFSGKALVAGEIYDLGTPVKTTVIEATSPAALEYNETSGSVSYSISDGGTLTGAVAVAYTEEGYDALTISDITIASATSVTFTVPVNQGDNPRMAKIKLSYTGVEDVEVVIKQKAEGVTTVTYTWDFNTYFSEAVTLSAGTYTYEAAEDETALLTYITSKTNDKVAKASGIYYLQPNGAASATDRVFSFTAPAAGTLTITGCSNGSDTRDLSVTLNNELIGATSGGSSSGNTPSDHIYSISGSGTVKFYASGIFRYYKIVFTNE